MNIFPLKRAERLIIKAYTHCILECSNKEKGLIKEVRKVLESIDQTIAPGDMAGFITRQLSDFTYSEQAPAISN